jgi:hypothetical protein
LATLVCTIEAYRWDAEQWHGLVDAVACDGRKVPVSRLTADEALELMVDSFGATRSAFGVAHAHA